MKTRNILNRFAFLTMRYVEWVFIHMLAFVATFGMALWRANFDGLAIGIDEIQKFVSIYIKSSNFWWNLLIYSVFPFLAEAILRYKSDKIIWVLFLRVLLILSFSLFLWFDLWANMGGLGQYYSDLFINQTRIIDLDSLFEAEWGAGFLGYLVSFGIYRAYQSLYKAFVIDGPENHRRR